MQVSVHNCIPFSRTTKKEESFSVKINSLNSVIWPVLRNTTCALVPCMALVACNGSDSDSGGTNITLLEDDNSQIESAPATSGIRTIAGDTALKVLPVGDSITQGVGGSCSYRTPLANSLAQCSVEFVGTMEHSKDSPFGCLETNFNHEGRAGARTTDLLAVAANGISKIQNAVELENPDVVLLHIGTNDINRGEPAGTFDSATGIGTGTIGGIDQVIEEILTASPGTSIYIADLIPWLENPDVEENMILLRELFDDLVTYRTRAGDSVKIVKVFDDFLPHMMQPDMIHPNSDGDAYLAAKWQSALNADGHCLITDNTIKIRKEAENGVTAGNMSTGWDSNASGAEFTSTTWVGEYRKDYVDIEYSVQHPGIYRILARVNAQEDNRARFFFQMIPGDIWPWTIPATGAFRTDYVRTSSIGRIYVYLNEGMHTARVYSRDTNAQLDWLELQYLGDDPGGDVDADGVPNITDEFPNDPKNS